MGQATTARPGDLPKSPRRHRLLVSTMEPGTQECLAAYLRLQFPTFWVVTEPVCPRVIHLATRYRFDLVITDLYRYFYNGFEIHSAIKASRPATRFILLTSYQFEEARHAAARAGMAWVFKLPVQLTEVRDIVGRLLGL